MADPEIDPMKQEDEGAAAAAPQSSAELKDLLLSYGRPLLLGAILAALVTVGVGHFRGRRQQAAEEAAHMLASGRPEQLEALLQQHAGTPSAPVAQLALARLDFHKGKYEAAEKRYADFVTAHPDHEFREVAEINRAQCIEALGRTEDALKAYDTILARKGNPLFASIAQIGRARCLEQSGQYDEARQVLEEYVAAYPEGPWAGAAEAAIRTIEQKRREAKAAVQIGLPVRAPAPAAPPATNTVPATPAP